MSVVLQILGLNLYPMVTCPHDLVSVAVADKTLTKSKLTRKSFVWVYFQITVHYQRKPDVVVWMRMALIGSHISMLPLKLVELFGKD